MTGCRFGKRPASSARRHEPALPPPHLRTPWYREPYVWLLIAFPAVAVLAGLITLALAIASDDDVPDDAPAKGATPSHATGEACHGRYGITPRPKRRRDDAGCPRRPPLGVLHPGLTPEGRPTPLPDTVEEPPNRCLRPSPPRGPPPADDPRTA